MSILDELRLWRERLAYRRARWHYWRARSNSKEMAKWQKLADEAHANTLRLERELHRPAPFKMYDSTELAAYPVNIGSDEAFATYVNGNREYQHFNELRARNPHAKWLTISVFPVKAGMCLDIEPGNARPDQAPGWVREKHAEGMARPWCYADRSEMGEVIEALTRDSIKRSEYLLWLADPTGHPHIPDGFDACQYLWQKVPNLDTSLVRAGLLG